MRAPILGWDASEALCIGPSCPDAGASSPSSPVLKRPSSAGSLTSRDRCSTSVEWTPAPVGKPRSAERQVEAFLRDQLDRNEALAWSVSEGGNSSREAHVGGRSSSRCGDGEKACGQPAEACGQPAEAPRNHRAISVEATVKAWLEGNAVQSEEESAVEEASAVEEPPPKQTGCYDLGHCEGWVWVSESDQEDDEAKEEMPGWIGHRESQPEAAPTGAVSLEGLVEAWMRSKLEGKSGSRAVKAIRPPKESRPGSGHQCQHFADSEGEDEAAQGDGLLRSGQPGGEDASNPSTQRRWSKPLLFPRFWATGRSAAHALNSMMNDNYQAHDEVWYGTHLLRLQQDGMLCSKVARNGSLVRRSVHIAVDTDSSCIEIRGGKAGPKVVRVNDITDVRRGLGSAEFRHFLRRFKKDQPSELETRAVVLLSPDRNLSLIMPTSDLRDALAHCVLYLLDPNPTSHHDGGS